MTNYAIGQHLFSFRTAYNAAARYLDKGEKLAEGGVSFNLEVIKP